MSESIRILPNYNFEDYLQWEGKWEIIDGIAYAMSPSPSVQHQILASRLNVVLANTIADKGCAHCEVVQLVDLKITENTVVQPDLSILCTPYQKEFLDYPPVLVVEILSPSTRQKDLITKYDLYRSFGVRYYLIVDPENESITGYELIGDEYKKVHPPFSLQLDEGCSFQIDFPGIFK